MKRIYKISIVARIWGIVLLTLGIFLILSPSQGFWANLDLAFFNIGSTLIGLIVLPAGLTTLFVNAQLTVTDQTITHTLWGKTRTLNWHDINHVELAGGLVWSIVKVYGRDGETVVMTILSGMYRDGLSIEDALNNQVHELARKAHA